MSGVSLGTVQAVQVLRKCVLKLSGVSFEDTPM